LQTRFNKRHSFGFYAVCSFEYFFEVYKNIALQVPRVFVNRQCIGGGDDTVILDKNGKLKELLENCKAI
jgi:hypothetical protein